MKVMNIKIEIDDYEVFSSGTIVTNANEDLIKFLIEDLIFEIQFLDEDNGEQKVNFESSSDKKVRFKFINFNNPLGTGNVVPVKLGRLNEKDLYFNFRVISFSGDKGVSGKTLYYTWMTKNE